MRHAAAHLQRNDGHSLDILVGRPDLGVVIENQVCINATAGLMQEG